MEISPEQRDTIKTFLSLVIGQDEAQRFANVGEAATLIKQGQPCWQAPVSIGVHAAILYAAEADAHEAFLQDLIGHALEPLEALLKSLVAKTGEKTQEDELARLLFHTRFGLGFLLLASGDEERAKTVLHEMASTQLSIRGAEVRSGPGIVRQTPDMAWGKFLTFLFIRTVCEAEEDYREALYLATEAIACSFGRPMRELICKSASELLDLWVSKCEDEDASREYDFPSWNWVDLFAEVAEILSVCQEADSTGVLPNDCEVESAQFLAWKFGQIAGRLAVHSRWRENPFGMALGFLRSELGAFDSTDFPRGIDKVSQALNMVGSFLCDYDLDRDWEKARQHYISMWNGCYTYRGMPLSEIGPESDLFWAMRIGFVDKMLSTTEQVAIIQLQTEMPSLIRDIEMPKDIASTIALRQIRQQSVLDKMLERLPPTTQEIHQHLQQWLTPVWSKLPGKVINTLVKAENYYRSEVNDDDAKVWFHKAVEASLNCCIVEPLVSFIDKRGDKQIAICFPPPRGVERKTSSSLRKLSLGEWSDVLETLTVPAHKNLAGLGTGDLKQFMKAHFGALRLPDFSELSRSLRTVHQYRKGSAHYEPATTRYDKEKWELEQMRNLVLGIDGPSVITQIFQILGAKEQLQ